MEKLKQHLDALVKTLSDGDSVLSRVKTLESRYPFNDYEYMISVLLGRGKLSLDDYYTLRDEYMERNVYRSIFEISHSVFGQQWAHRHLKDLVPALEEPSKEKDKHYSGQYDLWLDKKIRIEVKASRAVDSKSHEPLHVKALLSDSDRPFDMNFQQLKPYCCDVFVWIGVWRDKIRYWVLASKEVESNKYYSGGQHRGNTGEGQLHIKKGNIEKFSTHETTARDLLKDIRNAYQKQQA